MTNPHRVEIAFYTNKPAGSSRFREIWVNNGVLLGLLDTNLSQREVEPGPGDFFEGIFHPYTP